MAKYFGTDGVRGIANLGLTPELAFKLGRAGGYALTKTTEHPKVLVGRDTRISGYMLEVRLFLVCSPLASRLCGWGLSQLQVSLT
ncbi:phosphoglucosamine mutase [Sporolactobacillus inulinus]|uniref:Phosphoglucosamine mutase n=1 Tax=Sporolactobacillus inulinus TaxID=2078 RepID=A0A4Y1ZH22_9BACL|nr:phosphoglucosamine mutase [Sporolactobacillus inulinus]